MRRRCKTCQRPFDGERWQRECWECWRKQKAETERRAVFEAGWRAGRASALAELRPLIGGGLLERLIKLTHPDKHPPDRFGECNEVTRQLLEMKSVWAADQDARRRA